MVKSALDRELMGKESATLKEQFSQSGELITEI